MESKKQVLSYSEYFNFLEFASENVDLMFSGTNYESKSLQNKADKTVKYNPCAHVLGYSLCNTLLKFQQQCKHKCPVCNSYIESVEMKP